MRIHDDPIAVDPSKTLCIERFYAEFNDRLEVIVSEERSPRAQMKARECVSLCCTAVGAFSYQEDPEAVREVVCQFNRCANIIVDAGGFKLAQEFNILTYGPGVERGSQLQEEKDKLSKEFLPKLYRTDPQPAAPPQKYLKAAYFQGVENVAEWYHERYGGP